MLGVLAVGGIATYDNWKSVKPMLAQAPDVSAITAAIRPDAPKTVSRPEQRQAMTLPQQQPQRPLPPADVPVPAAQPVKASPVSISPAEALKGSAAFGYCGQGEHVNCVGDGGVFWYKGEKIVIADMVAPNVASARCEGERKLAFAAKSRLFKLLNAGPFTMNMAGKTGSDGAPRVISRDGRSFGTQLVTEGLARKPGAGSGWCA
jgi:endonuclease YncB( thermonuclease family)